MNFVRRLCVGLFVLALFAGPPQLPPSLFAVQPPQLQAAGSGWLDEGQSTTYVVQKGDSLSKIAARFGIGLDALVAANQLTTTVIQPGQVLIIPGVAPAAPAAPADPAASATPAPTASIYTRIQGGTAFIQRVTAALDWLQANDPDAFQRVEVYVTVITPSNFAHLATARPLPGGGCHVRALARRDMRVEMTATMLFHEASHCYQFATVGILSSKEAEVFAYTEQIAFMERHGFSAEALDYYRRVLAYYQSQPDDGRYIPPPDF